MSSIASATWSSEAAGAGTDRVNAYVSDTLGANVENLYLYGTATNGTGNDLDNVIEGNSNANTLSGLAGNDSLYGYDGNDTLNGGTGNDTMAGGTGNDTYIVDSAGDVVIEAAGAGIDSVNASVSYTLGANVENLILSRHGDQRDRQRSRTMSSTATATPTPCPDSPATTALYGYGGNDTLNGGTGNDTMAGGTGNDTYVVDSAGDVVIEAAGEGTDRVNASVELYPGRQCREPLPVRHGDQRDRQRPGQCHLRQQQRQHPVRTRRQRHPVRV